MLLISIITNFSELANWRQTVAQEGIAMVSTVLKKAVEHDVFQVGRFGKEAVTIATKLLNTPDKLITFSKEIVQDLVQFVPDGKLSTVKREYMWETFHNYRLKDEVQVKWELLLTTCGASGSHRATMILLQFVLRNTLESIICCSGVQTDILRPTCMNQKIDLTDTECEALRYVAGFIPFSLIKYYNRFKGNSAAESCICILKLWKRSETNSGENFLDFTKHWADLVDRGGLFQVHEGVYSFFWAVECVAKQYLSNGKCSPII